MSVAIETPVVFDCVGDRLLGVLHRPHVCNEAVGVMIVVGGPQYRVGSHRQFVLMARNLVRAGFPVLRFDYRGMGDAQGDSQNFENVTEDILAAIDGFRDLMPCLSQIVIWALCDATFAALWAARQRRFVGGLVLVNPWVRTTASEARAYLKQYYVRRILQGTFWRKLWARELEISSSLIGLLADLKRALAGNADRQPSFVSRMLACLDDFRGPVLFCLSGRDLTAEEFRALCTSDEGWQSSVSRATVEFEYMKDADHTFSRRRDLDHACELTIRWLERSFADRRGRGLDQL